MNAYLFWIRHVPEQSEKGVWRPACASRTREVCWGMRRISCFLGFIKGSELLSVWVCLGLFFY